MFYVNQLRVDNIFFSSSRAPREQRGAFFCVLAGALTLPHHCLYTFRQWLPGRIILPAIDRFLPLNFI